MRTPPKGKQGTPGTWQRTRAAEDAANDDRRAREISARQTLSDKPYEDIPCTDDALPLCAEDRRIARIEAPANDWRASFERFAQGIDAARTLHDGSDIIARRDFAGR